MFYLLRGFLILLLNGAGLVQPVHAMPALDFAHSPRRVTPTCDFSEWEWPLPGSRITKRYSLRHPGLDLSAPVGTRVRAVASGLVRYAADTGGPYGKLVIVRHPNGCETWYAHLQTIDVRWQQTVTPGDILGQMGGTGNANGWHLHLEVRWATTWIDPLTCLLTGRDRSRHYLE